MKRSLHPYFDDVCKVRRQERNRQRWLALRRVLIDILIILAFGFAAGTLDVWK